MLLFVPMTPGTWIYRETRFIDTWYHMNSYDWAPSQYTNIKKALKTPKIEDERGLQFSVVNIHYAGIWRVPTHCFRPASFCSVFHCKNARKVHPRGLDSSTIRSMSRYARFRAKLCVAQGVGHIEHLVKKTIEGNSSASNFYVHISLQFNALYNDLFFD